jgi:hypothetical protein
MKAGSLLFCALFCCIFSQIREKYFTELSSSKTGGFVFAKLVLKQGEPQEKLLNHFRKKLFAAAFLGRCARGVGSYQETNIDDLKRKNCLTHQSTPTPHERSLRILRRRRICQGMSIK